MYSKAIFLIKKCEGGHIILQRQSHKDKQTYCKIATQFQDLNCHQGLELFSPQHIYKQMIMVAKTYFAHWQCCIIPKIHVLSVLIMHLKQLIKWSKPYIHKNSCQSLYIYIWCFKDYHAVDVWKKLLELLILLQIFNHLSLSSFIYVLGSKDLGLNV